MDSTETKGKQSTPPSLLCRSFSLLVSFSLVLFLSFSLVLVTVVVGDLSISSPISIPRRCKIVSSSVDIRSSKVCELGLLNYKAKHVFYPSGKRKFRCHYDYYWASVFEVEFIDRSGQLQLALAEAPNEALPLDCRPNFGVAWLTKDKFKVNETYECWYTLGISKLHIYDDKLFNCQTNQLSALEMLRRYSIISAKMLTSWFVNKGRGRYWRWETIAGVFAGFITSFVSITLGTILVQLNLSFYRIFTLRFRHLAAYVDRLKRTCFLVAYFSFVGWCAIQYAKRLSVPEIFRAHS